MSMSKTLYPLHLLAQPRKTHHDMTEKIVDWDLKNQNKQNMHNDLSETLFI